MHPPLEYPLGRSDLRCLLWRNFLSDAECAQLLQDVERRGFCSAEANYPPSYRNNQRLIFDDLQLAQNLLLRLRYVLPEHNDGWVLDAINPRWRSCRYAPGQSFNLHQDGVFHAPDGRVSRLTFMLYLNDASEFSDGDTVFYDGPPDRQSAPRELGRVRPSAGALIVFEHALWHAGAAVQAGLKTILRSELMYRSAAAMDDHGHRGYVFCLASLDEQRYLSGGRDGTVRLHQTGVARSTVVARHAQSVLGLHALTATRFAAVSRDGCLAIHDLDPAASALNRKMQASAVLCVTGCSARLYSGGADHRIGIWDHQGQALARWIGHRGWVWDLAVLDAHRLFSVSEDQRVLLWDEGRIVDQLDLGCALRAVIVCTRSQRLVIADADGALHLLAFNTSHAPLRRLRTVQAHRAQIRKLRRCSDGRVLSCAEDGQIRRWDLQLNGGELMAQRDGFATDALLLGTRLVSAAYTGGVIDHVGTKGLRSVASISQNESSMGREWSDGLQELTRNALLDCPMTYDGFLHMKNSAGGFGKIAIGDVLSGCFRVQSKNGAPDQVYAHIDDLIAAAWAVD
jgi:WD40 repeat protein